MEERLQSLPRVESVFHEGAFSSIAIPLIMFTALANAHAHLHAVVGTGPLSDAIAASLFERGVKLYAKTIQEADSPVELSLRDRQGNHKTLRLYPASRTKYRQQWKLPDALRSEIAGMIVTRYNQGRAKALRTLADLNCATSLRIAESSRHISISDSLTLMPHANQVVVSNRGKTMSELAKSLGIAWESKCNGLAWDSASQQLLD